MDRRKVFDHYKVRGRDNEEENEEEEEASELDSLQNTSDRKSAEPDDAGLTPGERNVLRARRQQRSQYNGDGDNFERTGMEEYFPYRYTTDQHGETGLFTDSRHGNRRLHTDNRHGNRRLNTGGDLHKNVDNPDKHPGEAPLYSYNPHGNGHLHTDYPHGNRRPHTDNRHGNRRLNTGGDLHKYVDNPDKHPGEVPLYTDNRHENGHLHIDNRHGNERLHTDSRHGNRRLNTGGDLHKNVDNPDKHPGEAPLYTDNRHGNGHLHTDYRHGNHRLHTDNRHGNRRLNTGGDLHKNVDNRDKRPGEAPLYTDNRRENGRLHTDNRHENQRLHTDKRHENRRLNNGGDLHMYDNNPDSRGEARLYTESHHGNPRMYTDNRHEDSGIYTDNCHGESQLYTVNHRGEARLYTDSLHGNPGMNTDNRHGDSRMYTDNRHRESRMYTDNHRGDSRMYTDNSHGEAQLSTDNRREESRMETDNRHGDLRMYADNRRGEAQLSTDNRRGDSNMYTDNSYGDSRLYSDNRRGEARPYTGNRHGDSRLYGDSRHGKARPYTDNRHGKSCMDTDNGHGDSRMYTDNCRGEGQLYTDNRHGDSRLYTDNRRGDSRLYSDNRHREAQPYTNHGDSNMYTNRHEDPHVYTDNSYGNSQAYVEEEYLHTDSLHEDLRPYATNRHEGQRQYNENRHENPRAYRSKHPGGRRELSEPPPPSYDDAVRMFVRRGSDPRTISISRDYIAPIASMEEDFATPRHASGNRGDRDNRDEIELRDFRPNWHDDVANGRDIPDADTSNSLISEPIPARNENPVPLRSVFHDIDTTERGAPEEESEPWHCESVGFIDTALGMLYSWLHTRNSVLSPTRVILCAVFTVAVIGIILFTGIFSASFVYVNYYQIALRQNKLTGAVNRDEVVYPGCYVLGPSVDLIMFESTAQTVDSLVSVFTGDKLVVDIGVTLQYFIKPEEVGKLHSKFSTNYHEVLESIIFNTIKNEATKHTLQMYRYNRTQVEKSLQDKVEQRLGGNCCKACCPSSCKDNTVCTRCKPESTCDEGYHVNVPFFNLGQVKIPGDVYERFMRQTLLQIETEKEELVQMHALEVKKTELHKTRLLNKALEVRENGTAAAKVIRASSEAGYERDVQLSYVQALKSLYSRLNVTLEDHKLSLMMVRAFEDISHNLYSYDYEKYSHLGSA